MADDLDLFSDTTPAQADPLDLFAVDEQPAPAMPMPPQAAGLGGTSMQAPPDHDFSLALKNRVDWSKQPNVVSSSGPQSPEERAQEIFGFEDLAMRGNLLPLGRTQEGEATVATPGFIKQMLESATLPGQVMEGYQATPEETAQFTMNFLAPGTANRSLRPSAVPRAPTTKQVIKSAPTTAKLKETARPLFNRAEASPAEISPDSLSKWLTGAQKMLDDEGFVAEGFPKLSAALSKLENNAMGPQTLKKTKTLRKIIANAADSTEPSERRLGRMLRDNFDDYTDNLTVDDIVGGGAAETASAQQAMDTFRQARGLWTRAKKSEIIDDIFAKADLQASGFENGLRTGFRALLNNKRAAAKFSEAEKEAMRRVVKGDFTTNTLKRLSKLGFGTGQQSNYLGGMVGMGAGGAVGGAPGAMAVPALGGLAGQAANALTRKQSEFARALVATGNNVPQLSPVVQQAFQKRIQEQLARSQGIGGAALVSQRNR